MKSNLAKICYQSTVEPSNVFSNHNRYASNITKNSSATFDKQQFLSYQEEFKSNHNKRHSALYDNHVGQSKELQGAFNCLLQKIQSIIERSDWMSRHERIRINQWLVKLTCKQPNPVWKKNVNFYMQVMLEMMVNRKIGQPFMSLPIDGPLPKLTIYDLPYPIRQKFAQSKEKSQRRNQESKESKELKSVLDQKRNSIYKKSQSFNANFDISVLQKNGSWFQNNVNMNSSVLQSFQNQLGFGATEFQIQLPTKPVFSNNKARKQAINRSNHNSNKDEAMKNKTKFNSGNRDFQMKNVYDDKENNPNVANINRKLFQFKDEEKKLQIIRKDDWSKYSHDNPKTSLSAKYRGQDPNCAENLSNKQKFNVLPKVFELLQQNQSTLSSQPAYGQLLSQLSQLGKQLQISMLNQQESDKLNESTLSENSKAFIKASEQIRTKFRQTDNQTLQFMSYLNQLKRHKNK